MLSPPRQSMRGGKFDIGVGMYALTRAGSLPVTKFLMTMRLLSLMA